MFIDLSNTTVQFIKMADQFDSAGQVMESAGTVIFDNIPARVEQLTQTADVKYTGDAFHYQYLIHVWSEFDIMDADYIKDNTTLKKYKVGVIKGASLVFDGRRKIEIYCSVLADDRYDGYNLIIP